MNRRDGLPTVVIMCISVAVVDKQEVLRVLARDRGLFFLGQREQRGSDNGGKRSKLRQAGVSL